MSLTSSPTQADQTLTGQVLASLRKRAGKTQRDVGAALGMKAQAWQYYEAGDRKFTTEKIETVLASLKATWHDFEEEKARLLGSPAEPPSFAEVRQDFVFDVFGRTRVGAHGPETYNVADPVRRINLRQVLGPSVDALEVSGDRVSPWAQSGEIVFFDRDRAPRHSKGCVVETKKGEAFVLLYDKSDGSTLFLTELFPEQRTVTFPVSEMRGVYPVILRGD